MRFTPEQTKEAFRKLPEEIQEAIASVDTVYAIQAIGKNSSLMLDVVGQLEAEVGYALLGLSSLKEFSKTLEKELSLPREKAEAVTKEVDQKIFKPIRSSLMELHRSAIPVAPTPASTPAMPAYSTLNTKVSGPDYDMSRDAILSAIENPTPADVKVSHRFPETADPHEYISQRDHLIKILEKNNAATLNQDGSKKPSLTEEALLVARKKIEKIAEKKEVPPTPPSPAPKLNLAPEVIPIDRDLKTAVTLTPAPVIPTTSPADLARSALASAKAEGVIPPRSSVYKLPPLNIDPTPTAPSTAPSTPALTSLNTPIVKSAFVTLSAPAVTPADKLQNVVQVPRTVTNMTDLPASLPQTKPVSDPYREPV